MGAQWKQKGKLQTSSKRSSLFSKLVKEIIIAAKAGDPDPANNPRLRAVVETAKKQSLPKDNIERAIKKGSGLLEPVNYELVTFEGFTPHKVPCIVECLTDNRNRTSGDIKNLFRKGSLGATGTVTYLFNHLGMVEAVPPSGVLDFEDAAIEAGAQEVERTEEGARFFCELKDLIPVSKALSDLGWQVSVSEFSYVPKDPLDVSDEIRKEVEDFLNDIDDNDDVRRIFTALK